MYALLLLLAVQLGSDSLPSPSGYVNNFAGVLDPAAVSRMDAVIAEVRAKSRGEIAVVTLPGIGDRAASDVALQIGRQWGVGAKGAAGDPAKNLGVVVLLVPLKNHRRGTGQVFMREFGFTLTGAPAPTPPAETGQVPLPVGLVIALVVFLIIVTRGRILWWILALALSRSGGGRGGGWGG